MESPIHHPTAGRRILHIRADPRRINQKIQNNEQLTVEEQACVIETPKVRNAKKLCQQVGDQYTYQNNNAMVDYFDTDGYVTVQAVTGIKKPENNE